MLLESPAAKQGAWPSGRVPTSVCILLAFSLVSSTATGQSVIFVDDSAIDANDGSSWQDAFAHLQDALDAARQAGGLITEIRVAQGLYRPDQGDARTPGDREATFSLISGVALKGGYAGWGSIDPGERDIALYETILSGDLGGDDVGDLDDPSKGENSCHVTSAIGISELSFIEGFVITSGHAWYCANRCGAGMHAEDSSLLLSRCTFTRNFGYRSGGLCYYNSTLTLLGCTFRENMAFLGGAIYNRDASDATLIDCAFEGNRGDIAAGFNSANSNPVLVNCSFIGNMGGWTAGFRNEDGDPLLVNCLFTGNSASSSGAAFASFGSSAPSIINSSFVSNSTTGDSGGGIYHDEEGQLAVTNCVLWDNTDIDGSSESAQIHFATDPPIVDNSCIQGWTNTWGGVGNTGEDPLFVDADGPDNRYGTPDDNARLADGSPCIDTGDSEVLPLYASSDLDGNRRVLGSRVDMGAYEGPHQAFILSPSPSLVPEGGAAAIEISLAMDPGAPVAAAVSVSGGDSDISIDPHVPIVFNSVNFGIPQVVMLSAMQDIDFINGSTTILITAPGVPQLDRRVFESDDDPLPTVVYVDASADGMNTGMAWDDAFSELRDALPAVATRGADCEIWIARGVYKATVSHGDRAETFWVPADASLYGGFAGWEGRREQRDPTANATILSGDLNGDDGPEFTNMEDNSFTVVTIAGTASRPRLDGITITGGNAEGTTPKYPSKHRSGGGLSISKAAPMISNCVFTRNSAITGGAISSGGYGAVFEDCVFIDNSAQSRGGAMCTGDAETLRNCTFLYNTSRVGGGLWAFVSTPTLYNCVFHGNTSSWQGGGMCNDYLSNSTLVGCAFTENSTPHTEWRDGGGGFYNGRSATAVLSNSVFRQNSGGAVANVEGDISLSNSVMSSNVAGAGGGLRSTAGTNSVRNCLIVGNTGVWSENTGGGVSVDGAGEIVLDNCTLSGNRTRNWMGGSAIYISGDGHITNCAISRNFVMGYSGTLPQIQTYYDTIAYNCIHDPEGRGDGPGNISEDPRFVAPGHWDDAGTPDDADDDIWADGDYELQPDSPCIDAGDPEFVSDSGETDVGGLPRVLCGRVDMGAYEFGIGDYDCNHVLELTDFGAWENCMTGPDIGPLDLGCEAFDFDADSDVDLNDFTGFQLTLPPL